MLTLALAATLQASLFQFDLGPVHFSLGLDRKWELTAKSDEVDIDLDRLVIRSLKRGNQWSSGVLPFRDQGVLPQGQWSKSVQLEIWPPEWRNASEIRVEFEARRPNYLWHERTSVRALETPFQERPFSTDPGQRYIVIPTRALPPRFIDQDGLPVDALSLSFRVLKLVSSNPESHEFRVEETRQMVRLLSPEPPIAHAWLDGVTRQTASYHRNVWLPFHGIIFSDGGSVDLAGKPAILRGIYSLAKPRETLVTTWELSADRERISLEPGIAVLGIGSGKSMQVKAIFMPSVDYFATILRNQGPQQDFAKLKAPLSRPLSRLTDVSKGMTEAQVWWLKGPPIDRAKSGSDTIWTYRYVPAVQYTFRNGKVTRIEIGNLP